MDLATLGDKIRALRRDRKWTLKALSIRSGVSQSYISAIEKGKRLTPSFECIESLAEAFEIPIDYFCSGKKSVGTTILELYDGDTRHFIASESSLPYVAFAKQLAEEHALADPSQVLQLLAQFLREQKDAYQEG